MNTTRSFTENWVIPILIGVVSVIFIDKCVAPTFNLGELEGIIVGLIIGLIIVKFVAPAFNLEADQTTIIVVIISAVTATVMIETKFK